MGWLSGWDKRVKLTIDQTKIDTANQLNFPVLVSLSIASGITSADVSCVFDELTSDANRKKIAITTSDGVTQCYVEIERWDDANEKAVLWAKIPIITYNADTDLYLYYDKDHADNTIYIGDIGSTPGQTVWDSNFIGIWHMCQDPSGGANCIKDSTSNTNHGTPVGSMASGDLVDGKIGKALDFDGNDDGIDCNFNTNYSNFSVECIFNKNIDVPSGEIYTLISKGSYYASAMGDFPYSLYLDQDEKVRAAFDTGNDFASDIILGSNAVDNNIHYAERFYTFK